MSDHVVKGNKVVNSSVIQVASDFINTTQYFNNGRNNRMINMNSWINRQNVTVIRIWTRHDFCMWKIRNDLKIVSCRKDENLVTKNLCDPDFVTWMKTAWSRRWNGRFNQQWWRWWNGEATWSTNLFYTSMCKKDQISRLGRLSMAWEFDLTDWSFLHIDV